MSAQLQEVAPPQGGTRFQLLPMSSEHLPAVLEIEQRSYEFPWTDGILRDCLKAGYSSWVVHEPGGPVRGYCMLAMGVGEAHVLNLCVDPAFRRRQLARNMLDHLVRIARAANCTIVLLEVRKSNQGAIRLYTERGFERLAVRKGYYPAHDGREDAIILGLELT